MNTLGICTLILAELLEHILYSKTFEHCQLLQTQSQISPKFSPVSQSDQHFLRVLKPQVALMHTVRLGSGWADALADLSTIIPGDKNLLIDFVMQWTIYIHLFKLNILWINIIEPRHVTSNNVAFWQVLTQTSLCSLLLSLETPNDVQSVA